MTPRHHLCSCIALLLSLSGQPSLAYATEQEAGTTAEARSDWQQEKCEVYRRAFSEILDHVGREGVSDMFMARNQEFIDSGCLADVDACPETEADIEVANGLTIASMNAGAASSFSPFRCRQ